MSSASQTAANINNAKSSTGPQTDSGKARSSQNSLRHGLASGRIIIRGEAAEDFDALVADLVAEHKPATTTEELLVKQMAQNYWLTQRAIRLQGQCFTDSVNYTTKLVPPELPLLIRYQIANERAFHKALATLTKLQQERTKAAHGFVSQKPESARPLVQKATAPNHVEIPFSATTQPAASVFSHPVSPNPLMPVAASLA